VEALIRLATRRPVAVGVLAAAMVLVGLKAVDRLPVDLLPDLDSPTIVVSLSAGDRPPSEMERVYGERIEQRLFTVRDIREVFQVARTGRLIATVVFDWGADMDLALVDVQKAVQPLEGDPDVEELLVRRFDPRRAPVVTVGLISEDQGPSLAELRRIARRQIAPGLERLDGVAQARVLGGREREVRVVIDRYRLEAFALTLSEVGSRLRRANVDLDAGTLEEGERVYLVRGRERFRAPEDIARVVLTYVQAEGGELRPVRVRDVATVSDSDAPFHHLVRVGGREGVALQIHKEAGANTVSVSRVVREALDELARDVPGVRATVASDEAALVEDALEDVRVAALAGVVLAVFVLAVFLRSFAPTVLLAAAVPVSLLATVFLMHLADRSLNIMTLAGLALGAGLLVDNAIVVVESIFRRLEQGEPPREAAATGALRVAGAIVASTLTTCVVFLPVVFLRGLPARLMAGLSFTVIASLLVSLLVSLLIVPALSVWLLPRSRAPRAMRGERWLERTVATWVRRPLPVLGVTLVLVGTSGWGLWSLGTELLPPPDPRQFSLRVVGPSGMRVESTARTVRMLEEIVEKAAGGHVAAILSEVGRVPEDDRMIRDELTEENTARLRVRLDGSGPTAQQVARRAAPAVERLERVSVSWEIGSSSLTQVLGGGGPPIAVEITGRSLEDLRRSTERLAGGMRAQAALWNVRSSFSGGTPQLLVRVDRQLADGLGVEIEEVIALLEASLDGRHATEMTRGDEELDVVLRLPPARRDQLADLELTTGSGRRVALSQVARFVEAEGAREIFRRDQRRMARVTARIAPGADYPEAVSAARRALERTSLPPGLSARLAGQEEERSRTLGELASAFALAVVLVLMVLAGKFESLLHPFSVLSAIPIAGIGVAAALWPLGHPLGVMVLLGAIVLAGIAVNDAILLADTARQLRAEGRSRREALARAAALRLRPILMTTATTVLALLPLAVGTGDAARLRAPLALTIIAGLIASTVGSLLVVPCVYERVDRLTRRGRSE
jgi:HAE1 family hydrophobic/amphiphilic exporter-1